MDFYQPPPPAYLYVRNFHTDNRPPPKPAHTVRVCVVFLLTFQQLSYTMLKNIFNEVGRPRRENFQYKKLTLVCSRITIVIPLRRDGLKHTSSRYTRFVWWIGRTIYFFFFSFHSPFSRRCSSVINNWYVSRGKSSIMRYSSLNWIRAHRYIQPLNTQTFSPLDT